jgi:hypothetical protein
VYFLWGKTDSGYFQIGRGRDTTEDKAAVWVRHRVMLGSHIGDDSHLQWFAGGLVDDAALNGGSLLGMGLCGRDEGEKEDEQFGKGIFHHRSGPDARSGKIAGF